MIAVDFPFRIQSGSVATTTSYPRVVRAQLVDTLMTNFRERVMRPEYGSDIQSLLFNPSDELRRDDTAGVIQERLAYAVPRALIDAVLISPREQEPFVVDITVAYRVNDFSDPETLVVPIRGGESG